MRQSSELPWKHFVAKSFQKGPHELSELLEMLLESAWCGVLVLDGERRIFLTNKVFDSNLGIQLEEVAGKPMVEVLTCSRDPGNGGGRCEPGSSCVSCEIGRVIAGTSRDGESRRRAIAVELGPPDVVRTADIELSATPLRFGDQKLILVTIENLDEIHQLKQSAHHGGMHGMLGVNPRMASMFNKIRRVAPLDVPVLIEGESGSGKEMVAEALHRESRRSGRRMVSVNCGALSLGLLESELFGHVKGAFTGALRDKKGRFELANGGTIFLDEVGELDSQMQVRLLRVLQDGTFEKVGGEKTVRVDARVICATSRDLEREMAVGGFRADLYYRLCVFRISVPPLRDRPEDLVLLAEHLLAKAAQDYDVEAPQLAPSIREILLHHRWPGNVRELENAMRHAIIRSRGCDIEPEHLPPAVVRHRDGRPRGVVSKNRKLSDATVAEALLLAGGNKVKASRVLGVSRSTLYRYLEEWQKSVEG